MTQILTVVTTMLLFALSYGCREDVWFDVGPERDGEFRTVAIVVFDSDESVRVGDGKFYFLVNKRLHEECLFQVDAEVVAPGHGGHLIVDLAKCRGEGGGICKGATDMLLSNLTIDSGETSSATAAMPVDINPSEARVTEGQFIRVDVDTTYTTPAMGLYLYLKLSKGGGMPCLS